MTGRDRLSPRSRFLGTLRLAKVAPGGRSLGSRLDGSLQVPHTGVAAATFLENDKNSSNEKEQQVHFFWGMKRPKTRLPVSAAEIHLEQPVHIGLGDIAQLFAKSGLNRTPFHTVGFGEHLVKQVPMLEAPRQPQEKYIRCAIFFCGKMKLSIVLVLFSFKTPYCTCFIKNSLTISLFLGLIYMITLYYWYWSFFFF